MEDALAPREYFWHGPRGFDHEGQGILQLTHFAKDRGIKHKRVSCLPDYVVDPIATIRIIPIVL